MKRVPVLAWRSAFHSETIISVISLFVLLYSATAGESATHWLGQNTYAVWAVLAVIFTELVMRVVYEQHEEITKERDALQKRDALSLVRPQLRGKIKNLYVFEYPEEKGSSASALLVEIGNVGEPSIANEWTCYVRKSDGTRIDGKVVWFETLSFTDGSRVSPIVLPEQPQPRILKEITSEDMIFNKTIQPIPKGGSVSGYLVAILSGVAEYEITVTGTVFTIEFGDVLGDRHSCTIAWEEIRKEPIGSVRFPGE